MPSPPSHALVRATIAALLLVLQLSPPVVRHSHALGEGPDSGRGVALAGHAPCRGHSHGHKHSHGEGHSHDDVGQHGAHGATGHSHGAIADATPHVHVQLLAFRFTLPLGNSSDKGDDGDRDFGNEAEFVIAGGFSPLLGDILTAEREGWPAGVEQAAMSPAVFCDLDEGNTRSGVFSAAPPRPLCDAARHERSGVQLI